MRRLLFYGVLVLFSAGAGLFAQDQTATLSASLAKEEKLLEASSPITAADVVRLHAIVEKIREVKNPELLSRAELLLVLFNENEDTKAATAAYNQAILDEARTIRSYRWQNTKGVLVKTGFWLGLSSLGLLGVSQAVGSWAADQYVQQTTITAATPYFITGQISQLSSTVGALGAIGGLGIAWLLSVNPFDIPSPATATAIDFPKSGMTPAEKIAYLRKTKTSYEKREKRARTGRSLSLTSLATGLAGVLATGIVGYLGNLEYQKYTASTTAADATTYRNTVTTYEYIAIGTASLAFVGLTGATIGYLFGPDPAQLSSSIDALNSQLRTLQEER